MEAVTEERKKIMIAMKEGICKTITYKGSVGNNCSKDDMTTISCSIPRGGDIVVFDAHQTIYDKTDLAFITLELGDMKKDFYGCSSVSNFLIPIKCYLNARVYITYYTDVDMRQISRDVIFRSYKISNSSYGIIKSSSDNNVLLKKLNSPNVRYKGSIEGYFKNL